MEAANDGLSRLTRSDLAFEPKRVAAEVLLGERVFRLQLSAQAPLELEGYVPLGVMRVDDLGVGAQVDCAARVAKVKWPLPIGRVCGLLQEE